MSEDPLLGGDLEASTLPSPEPPDNKLGDIAASAGLRSIEVYAWRDLDHPEAGGSEVHVARIAERWAAAGIDVTITASRAPGGSPSQERDGYKVVRPAGRYLVFPAAAAKALVNGRGRADAVVEVWNGMPFFTPVWTRKPRITFLHHVHGDMWDLVMPAPLAAVGKSVESRVAPPFYRHDPVITLSESSRLTIIDKLRLDPSRVSVVAPGVDERFRPGPHVDPRPTVVAVGRLVPYKRFDLLIDVLVKVREKHPTLAAVIAGEGAERPALESLICRRGASDWISLPGRLDDEALVDLYQRSWVLASTSAFEGWGLTISEAAACGTPAVVSPITGHSDAVRPGFSGYLAEPGTPMAEAISALLDNDLLRRRMRHGAIANAANLSWDRAAIESMRVLASSARRSPAV
ncbi:MAG TPA: glycosyltransferase family 4 protein [Acidimicrobiales bacterium]|nr:glycosyltransferase family 4 protein [Acidimicrobiales bacterium]